MSVLVLSLEAAGAVVAVAGIVPLVAAIVALVPRVGVYVKILPVPPTLVRTPLTLRRGATLPWSLPGAKNRLSSLSPVVIFPRPRV